MRFRDWIGTHVFLEEDIFGFERNREEDLPLKKDPELPIDQFSIELMMDYLEHKSLSGLFPKRNFMNEIQWGIESGAIRLEVDPGFTFFIKKLAVDRQGTPRWITKKVFQLNRTGHGGAEDSVAQEIFSHLRHNHDQGGIEGPTEKYEDLEALVHNMYGKLKRVASELFIPEGIKQLSKDTYLLLFGVRGQGMQAADQQRIEQNQTMVTYDEHQGTIRVTNYNLSSDVGRQHSFRINPNDLDLYFFPSQGIEEIIDPIAVHMKHY